MVSMAHAQEPTARKWRGSRLRRRRLPSPSALSALCSLGGRGGRGRGQVRCSWGCASGGGLRTASCAASHRASLARRPQRTSSSHFISTRRQLASCLCVRLATRLVGAQSTERQPRNIQNAGAGVVGLAHACPALSFCHRITQRVLQPQHGALWLCIVPAASSRTAASFSSRSARRDETWSSVELIVS